MGSLYGRIGGNKVDFKSENIGSFCVDNFQPVLHFTVFYTFDNILKNPG